MDKEILDYYSSGIETSRLDAGGSVLEKIRTQALISRYVKNRPIRILDVGGGAGVYAYWLKEMGHEVHLIDPSPVNLENARKAGHTVKLDSIREGVAEALPYEAAHFDAVLLLGPLYHLTERKDRVRALKESVRVLRKGGNLFAAVISRYASLLDGFTRNLVADQAFVPIMQQDLKDGQHRNPTPNPEYFTTAFFHHPHELRAELEEAGLKVEAVLPVESFGWLIPELGEKWKDTGFRELLLQTLQTIEQDETMIGVSAHILAIATKP